MKFQIQNYIRNIDNFPKKGITFKDITPLLANANAVQNTIQLFLEKIPYKIDKVVGIEARGFFFGTLLAEHLNAGFVPVRKKGKLPYQTYEETYELEYGIDTLTMHIDAIKKGEKVLIHDDVLATGGTAEAVLKLIKKAGGEIVLLSFLIELDFLKGRTKLNNHKIISLLHY